jgi:hypothetical protein
MRQGWLWQEWVHGDPDFAVTLNPLGLLNQDAASNYHHLNWTGALAAEWDRFGFLPETDAYSQNENWLRAQEIAIGKGPCCLPFPVYHLWHPPVLHGGQPRSVRIDRIQGGSGDDAAR